MVAIKIQRGRAGGGGNTVVEVTAGVAENWQGGEWNGGECTAFFPWTPGERGARAGVCENFYPEIGSVDGTHFKRYGKWPPGRIFFSTGLIIFEEWSFYGNLSVPQGKSVITKTEICDG